MGVKLTKKIKDVKFYYLVSDDMFEDKFHEYYLFEYHKELPIIEDICFKIMSNELSDSYRYKEFNNKGYKYKLLANSGIIIEGNTIKLKTCKYFYNIVNGIRYIELYNVINDMKKNLEVETLNHYRNKILEIQVEKLSDTTQELFKELMKRFSSIQDKQEFFKEIMFLTTIDYYNEVYPFVDKREQEIKHYPEWGQE